MNDNNVSRSEEFVVEFFRDLFNSLPTETASLKIRRKPEIQLEGVSVCIIPRRLNSAQITADAENGDPIISLVLGRATHYEVFPSPQMSRLEQLKEICKSVIGGDFEEEIWSVGSEVVKCVGRIRWKGENKKTYFRGRFFPLRRKARQVIKYSPYIQE